jgi:hypothetical protein
MKWPGSRGWGAVAALAALIAAAAPAGAAASERAYVEIGGDRLRASMATEEMEVRLYAEPDEVHGAEWLVPVVEVWHRGELVARERSRAGGDAAYPARASLAEMDPANDTPEVVLESYTGGAHCCTEILVITKTAEGRWETIELGLFNGAGSYVEDADNDGVYEIVTIDNAFLYAFGCYACSAAPLQILAVKDGEVRDVSFEPRYSRRHRKHLALIEDRLEPSGPVENGILAGWVAQKAILGKGAEAWAEMLLRYDRQEIWGLEFCRDGAAVCPEAERILRPFPEVLREFLHELGYRL